MADEADKNIEKAAGVGGGGGSKLVPILLIVNLVLVAAVLAALLLKGGGGGSGPEPAAVDGKAAEHAGEGEPAGKGGKAPPPGPTVKLADFVVHLRNVESDRYARLSFEIEVATEEDKNEFSALMPRVRDGFLTYLSDRTLEELRGGEAIARTKKALEDRLAELAPGVKVRALYVTDLVIQ